MTEKRTMQKKRVGRDTFSLRSSPVFATAVVLLFCLGVVLLPGEKLGKLFMGHGGTDARNLGNALFRFVGCAVAVWLLLDLGWKTFGFSARGLLLALPFLVVVIDNAPLVGVANGSVAIHASARSWALFAFNCLTVGAFEETVFRGILLPLFIRNFSPTRRGVFWAVVLSSALFGAVHLVNLLSGNVGAVVMQIGYSFLIGAMCAIALLLTHNLGVSVVLHAAFNFCGLVADELGTGQTWNALSITLTAVIGTLAAAYGVFLIVRVLRPEESRMLCGEEIKKEEQNETDE